MVVIQRLRERPAFRLVLLILVVCLATCARQTPSTPPVDSPDLPRPSLTASVTPSLAVTLSPTVNDHLPVWGNFPAPQQTPATPIPPPVTGLSIPDEVRAVVVAGVDRPLPSKGRTDAIALVIYHPRLARASVLSIPPDLFGYLPGYTMQRMNIAYAVGGPRLLSSAIEYNFGIKPETYAVFNLDSFGQLINDLGGINVNVLENVLRACPNIPPGVVYMDGEKALCYMRLRSGEDEYGRNGRQQEVMRAIFMRFVTGGNFLRLPALYDTYRSSIDSNVTLDELTDSMSLALKLGDPSRIGYFRLDDTQLSVWQISEQPPASVFLPDPSGVKDLVQQAVNFVTTPNPLSDVVLTYQYELTISPTPTTTYTATPTPTNTFTPSMTPTIKSTTTLTLTPSLTYTITPTRTITRTRTATPTRTVTPSVTLPPTETAPATSTATNTMTPTVTETTPAPTEEPTP